MLIDLSKVFLLHTICPIHMHLNAWFLKRQKGKFFCWSELGKQNIQGSSYSFEPKSLCKGSSLSLIPHSFLPPLTALASWGNMQTKGLALHTLSVLHPSPHPRGWGLGSSLKSYVGEVLSQVPTPLMCLMATSSYT